MSDIDLSELAHLRELADSLGISYTARTSAESLQKKIDEFNKTPEDDLSPEDILKVETPLPLKSLRQHVYDEQMALVRIRLTCLDPKKKDLSGEIITVSNNYLGTQRKFVPYGSDNDDGWHVPKCIYTVLKESTFLSIRVDKDRKTGKEIITSNYVPQYAIEVLPPLTPKELADLANAQAAAGE